MSSCKQFTSRSCAKCCKETMHIKEVCHDCGHKFESIAIHIDPEFRNFDICQKRANAKRRRK